MEYLCITGNHPALSSAELLGVLAAHNVSVQPTFLESGDVLLTADKTIEHKQIATLGGTSKVAEIIGKKESAWTAAEVAPLVLSPTEQKITLGFSLLPAREAKRLGSDLKKIAREQKLRVRFVLPKTGHRHSPAASAGHPALNAAQVIFNQLTTPPNAELLFFEHAGQHYLARTIYIQDIQAYEQRDTARPYRDPVVGMLPPKLAQMMINLAVTKVKKSEAFILDPFCGMGTILQEGWLLGHHLYGLDVDPTMVTASQGNIRYLAQSLGLPEDALPVVAQHDVRQPFPADLHDRFDAIVTEPYLGQALRSPLSAEHVPKAMDTLGTLYLTFFKNAVSVLKPGGVVLFILPAFRTEPERFAFFPEGFLDAVAKIGYRRLQLIPKEVLPPSSPSPREIALYARPDALVGRELTLWQKL
jgi:tRNA G10  N-methylase Trm11